jgi:hypothetical protein
MYKQVIIFLYIDSEFRNSPLPESFRFIEGSVPPGRGFIAPHATNLSGAVPLRPSAALTPHDLTEIRDGTKFFYVWGWLRYFDAFPATPERITRFCWQILVTGDPAAFSPGQSVVTLSFAYVQQAFGNCADEECDG